MQAAQACELQLLLLSRNQKNAGVSDENFSIPRTVLMHLDVGLYFSISCMHEMFAAGQ